MPTSEANTAALKNTNASTALGTEEAESSKANVCIIMTQDQCLDNVHQTTSNIHSANDQVSDDLNNSKNNFVSNGVNNMQEFNVDVNSKRSEHSANVAIVQNSTVDADSPSAGKVLTTSEYSATVSSDSGDLKENLDKLVETIDASECANNTLLPDMTVITHQNSSENIRDIIATSEKINKVSNDSDLSGLNNNVNSGKHPVNRNSLHKSGTTKKKLISSKSKHNSKGETDKPEDPVERLNKLRASISNALSEVKGVLKQYSTEQSFDGENESTPSSQPSDDGPVRFRFVRKIRRRSVFSEDDNGKVPENKENDKESKSEPSQAENFIGDDTKISPDAEQTSLTFFEQRKTDQTHEVSKDHQNEEPGKSSHATLEVNAQKEETYKQEQEISLNQRKSKTQIEEKHAIKFPATTDENTNNLAEIEQLTQSTPANSIITPAKSKTTKCKKLTKKDRRASIAAVEINQVLTDKLTPLELTTQRRPSDSGTLVKQTVRIKAKTNEKIKLPSQRQTKTLPTGKAEVLACITPTAEPNQSSQLILDESNNTAQNTSNSLTATHGEISTTSAKIEKNQKELDKEASAINISKNKTLPLAKEIKNSNAVDIQLTQISSESENAAKLSAQVKSKSNEKCTLVSHRQTKTTPVIKTDVATKIPTLPTVVEPSHLIQRHTDDVNIITSEEPKESDQTIRNPPAATPDKTTEIPVKVDPVNAITATVGQNEPKASTPSTPNPPAATPDKAPVALITPVKVDVVKVIVAQNQPEALNPPATTPDKTSTALINETPAKVDAVNAIIVTVTQNQPKTSAPSTPNPPTVTPDKAPVALITPVKVDAVKVIVAQNQPKSLNPPATTPVKTSTALINETPAKVDAVKAITVTVGQNQPKVTAPSTPNPPTATSDKASIALSTPVKVNANAVKVIVAQNQSKQSSNTNALQTKSDNTKSNRETPTFNITLNNTDLIVKTTNLLVEKKPEVSDIPIMQVPESSLVHDPIKSAQPEVEYPSTNEITKEPELVEKESVEEEEDSPASTPETTPEVAAAHPKKKRKAKRKVVIRRIKRKLSKDDTFIQTQETPSELEICEKEIEEKDLDEESEDETEEVPKQRKSCLKARQFEIGDIVMYAERYRKTQVKWRKATVIERITSISYKLDIEGEEKPAHISYIKKFTDRKVNFGGKEYLEIDYAQIEEDEEKERNYSIWNHV